MQVRCIEKALVQYRWLIDYHAAHTQAVEKVFGEEMSVCKEMAELLPMRIASLTRRGHP